MLSMRADTLVSSLVRQLLVLEGGRDDEALHFHLDLRMGHYTNEHSYNASSGLHLLYYLRKGYSYVDVFSAVKESPFHRIDKSIEWTHECSHDSCWRDVSVFASTYFNMAEKINSQLVADGFDKIAPANMHEHNSFCGYERAYNWVPVIVSKDPNDERSYRRVIELL